MRECDTLLLGDGTQRGAVPGAALPRAEGRERAQRERPGTRGAEQERGAHGDGGGRLLGGAGGAAGGPPHAGVLQLAPEVRGGRQGKLVHRLAIGIGLSLL